MSMHTISARRTSSNQVMPIRRDLKFQLPADKVTTWHRGSEHLSHFVNTFSLFLPSGERFFIDAVRAYRYRVEDPVLKEEVMAFIAQEAMHGREHRALNDVFIAAVPEAEGIERFVTRLLAWLKHNAPRSYRLSGTIALEHFTAILADQVLSDPRVLEGADPRYAAMLRWHALEETEHKAVAFDVWETVMGRGSRAYVLRCGGLLVATVVFWGIAIPSFLRVLRARGKLGDRAGWRLFKRHFVTETRFLPNLVKPWATYFRPDFHPWDHDNRHVLSQLDTVLGEGAY
ncbi:metal-dependent hydrolase [Pendulispora albinea]|uniref:Metal-dependent hydrolase n=1 Tax=Pendulispora albinea TaxID=2741071 RepID=A0ABZ2LVG3_9BACT